MNEDALLLFIDAIEGDDAWILLGEQRHRMARALLPQDAREGAWLRLSVDAAQARKMTEAIEARRQRMLQDRPPGKLKL
jgi:hypothetical protein